ncbi:hypothetical protein [Saccharothrix sp. HUAS TT1]|uniref:hypothetical protein n=1 Tax=unclassified Saccharothrix TaxID=2593673 RepID=UPI00345C3385
MNPLDPPRRDDQPGGGHRGDQQDVPPLARNLLPIASAVGLVLTALLPVLDLLGVQLPDVLPDRVATLIGALFLLGTLVYSRLRTTPLVDPRDQDGRPLAITQPTIRPAEPDQRWRNPDD